LTEKPKTVSSYDSWDKETFEDIKRVISICESKKDRQYNGQKKKDKQRSKNHSTETKDRATRTAVNSGALER